MATAYTIRYGKPKAGVGPGGGAACGTELVSESALGRGDAMAAILGEGDGALVSGGGSMLECDVGGLDGNTGSGSGGMSSAARESMMISFVSTLADRIW